MRVITSGKPYLEIDGYGGTLAYAELLTLQGQSAKAASTSVLNASIPPLVLAWQAPLDTAYQPSSDDTFAIIDTSSPEHFDKIVTIDRVDEVIDHHPGQEKYWQERLGDKADIEFAGAACTMIFERWKRANLLEKISKTSARVLICGILDNTLNFGADITTNRDKQAYQKLMAIADLPKDWSAQYFSACQEVIASDLETAIRDDAKILKFDQLPEPIGVGQLVIWDAKKLVAKELATIKQVMSTIKTPWFMNTISIGEGKNYLICTNSGIQSWLEDLLGTKFDGNIAPTNRMWLRKEIIKQSLQAAGDVPRE